MLSAWVSWEARGCGLRLQGERRGIFVWSVLSVGWFDAAGGRRVAGLDHTAAAQQSYGSGWAPNDALGLGSPFKLSPNSIFGFLHVVEVQV